MKFSPKTEGDINFERLLPEGVYDFEVTGAEDATSKSGNEMIKLGVKVYAPDGTGRQITDYLLEKMAFKLRHFAYATGLGNEYDKGTLAAAMCVGRSGKARIAHENQVGFPPKNSIKDYVVEATAAASAPPASEKPRAAASTDEPPF